MALFLKKEMETSVVGEGGYIKIVQLDTDGVYSEIWLTINQFSEIFNQEKHLIAEALGLDDEEKP